jgi:hypothetical protein
MRCCGDCDLFGSECVYEWKLPEDNACDDFVECATNIVDEFLIISKELVRQNDKAANEFRPSTKEEIYKNIKETNSDGRTHCCACGQQLNEPYPGIRYCKNCEV